MRAVSTNDRSQKSERTMIAAFIKASGAAIQGPGGCMVVRSPPCVKSSDLSPRIRPKPHGGTKQMKFRTTAIAATFVSAAVLVAGCNDDAKTPAAPRPDQPARQPPHTPAA